MADEQSDATSGWQPMGVTATFEDDLRARRSHRGGIGIRERLGLPDPETPPPGLPTAPSANPFAELPFPSPGDRIKAEDFRQLSQALRVLTDAYALAGATFAQPFGQVRTALTGQGYEITRVVSAGGTGLTAPDDTSLDARRVLQVTPVALGERRVTIVLTEPADTRRIMPDITGQTYPQAVQRITEQLGEDAVRGSPLDVPSLQGLTLTEATARVPR